MLRVLKRIDFKVILLYCALHDQAPEYSRDMLQERINVQTLRSIVSSQFAVPRNRLQGFAALRLWNALPGPMTDCKSIGALK